MNVSVELRNSGYAPLYNRRTAYIVLKNNDNTYSLPLQADPRRWLPNGARSQIIEQVDLPSDVAEGEYHLYLWLPDRHETIQNDPRYAIRFGNTDVWDSNTGYNDLGATITISNSAPSDPEVVPEGNLSPALPAREGVKVVEEGQVLVLTQDGAKYTITGKKIK